MIFTDYSLARQKRDDFDQLHSILGTHWTREQVQAMCQPRLDEENRKAPDEVMVPLAFWINGGAQEWLQNTFGSSQKPDWVEGEVVEGFEMDREAFIQMASMFAPLARGAG